MTEILPNLYLGSFREASDDSWLEDHSIKYIINVAAELNITTEKAEVYYFPFRDSPFEELEPWLEILANLMRILIKKGAILIHCYQGVSRSVAFSIYYLMREYRYSYAEAFAFIQEKRPNINPNTGFRLCLQHQEYKLNQIMKTRWKSTK